MFGFGWQLTAGLISGAVALCVVGGLLLSKEIKESRYKKRANDATSLEECFAKANGAKELNLCYEQNKRRIK